MAKQKPAPRLGMPHEGEFDAWDDARMTLMGLGVLAAVIGVPLLILYALASLFG